MLMFVAVMMLFAMRDGRRFKAEFAMSHVTTCICDVTADAKRAGGKDQCDSCYC